MLKKIFAASAVLVACGVMSSSQAQSNDQVTYNKGGFFDLQDNRNEDDAGFYVGLGIARASLDFQDQSEVDVEFEDTENAYLGRVGYMFSNWIGVEGAYYRFNNYQNIDSDVLDNYDLQGISNADVDIDAFTASIVLNLPLQYVDLYAKGGFANLEGTASATSDRTTVTLTDSSTEPFAVVGAELDFGQFNLFSEYTRILDNDDYSVDLLSAGIKFEF